MWCYYGHFQPHKQFQTLDQHGIIQLHGCVSSHTHTHTHMYHMAWASIILPLHKKLTLIQILDSVNTNSKNSMNNVGIFNDSVVMKSIFNEILG